jgi:hypothetical protein
VARHARGLLLLDVDGPLNPYGAKPHRPTGYLTFHETAEGEWVGTDEEVDSHFVWLNPGHGRLLTALADETGLELVWATAWQHAANARVAPAIGVDRLPVIEFGHTDVEYDDRGYLTWRLDGGWKWPAVVAYAQGRPLAWLDDEHNDPDFAVARAAFHRDRAGSPTLLCHVDPAVGLQPRHLDEIRTWAANLG